MTEFQQLKELILGKLENELPTHLYYHNINHTADVIRATAFIADNEGVDVHDKHIIKKNKLFHDTGFLNKRADHEVESFRIAQHYLPYYKYKPGEIDRICNMILATKIPQSPNNHLEEILCDADLDYLGRDDFFMLSNRLFLELCAESIVKDEDEWNREQADFMGTHRYHTETSKKLRRPKKEQYIEFVKSKISNQIFNENR